MQKRTRILALCECAVLLALAFVLSMIKLYRLPNAGSVTVVSMLPVLLIGVRWGPRWSFGSAVIFALLQFFSGIYAITPLQLFLDYIAAYGVLGLSGLLRGRHALVLSVPICGILRFFFHFLAGATVWAAYMPEEFFGMTMTSPWQYSLLYNGSFMLPELLITLVAAALLQRPLRTYLRRSRSVPEKKSPGS